MSKNYLSLFIVISLVLSAFANDNSGDLSDSEKIKIYNEQKAIVYHRNSIGDEKSIIDNQLYGDRVRFDIFRGNNDKVKLSTLLFEMGNPLLAQNLKWGEIYYPMMGGLIASIVTSVVLDVLGITFTLFQEDIYSGDTINLAENPNLILGISFLGTSVTTIVGIIIFSILMYKGSAYNFNVIQTKSLVDQYNKFLRNKLKIDAIPDVSFDNKGVSFCFLVKI